MITQHQYLDKYPIHPESKILILGTIHPHTIAEFKIPFFYGNKNSIWNLLSDAFPDELPKPLDLEKIQHFLSQRKIAVSDTIRECRRTNSKALDQDLIPEKLNVDLIEQIRNSRIEKILCTSGFGKNNAFKLFYKDILGKDITQEIKHKKEVMLDESLFGRPVLVKVLYSPSGASNISLSKSELYLQNAHKYAGVSKKPVYDFKVDHYREQFSR